MTNVFNEEIFKPGFKLEGPHLVAASAGTGKTYNIQNIYARLVMEKGFRVAQIQVMTFTEAATKELRGRVLEVLSNMARFFAGETEGLKRDELERLAKLRDCARATIGDGGGTDPDAVVRARLELALMEFDQAAISTIHGFCRRALVRFAFETDSAFRTEFADTKSEDLSRRVRDWWRRGRPLLNGAVRDGLNLKTLDGFVRALAGKSDWRIDAGAANDPNSQALAIAEKIIDGYEADRPVRDTQTFDDLLRGLRSALRDARKGPMLAMRLRDEFKAALVDEFQDTDPVQYDILRRVFLDPAVHPAPTIFFVGDPKQAIYAFRGGDIYTYRKAVTEKAVEASTFRLDKNFRSTPRLIDAVNTLFMDGQKPDGSPDYTFGDKSIDYPGPLGASDKAAFTLPDGHDDPSPFRIVMVEDGHESIQAVIDTVLGILKEQRANGVSPKDIAILLPGVRKYGGGSIAEDYRDALNSVNVPVVLQRAGNVFAGELAADLRQVLMAMALIGGRGQVKTALLTRFFSFDDKEKFFSDEAFLADMIGFFGDLNRKWRKRGFNAALAALETHPRCDFRRNLAKRQDGERLLADLMQIVDLAGSAVMEIGPSPEALVNWITERINQAGKDGGEVDSDEYARQLESESDALKIMTIHVSKGLEFPVVIVPLADGKTAKPPYFYHDEDMNLHVGMSDDAAARAQDECDAEWMRLLYVAFTRATKRTVVVAREPAPDSPLGRLFANARKPGAGEDNPSDSPILWKDYKPADPPLPNYRPDSPIAPEALCEAEVPRGYSQHRQKGSYSSLSPSLEEDEDGKTGLNGWDAIDRPGDGDDLSDTGLDRDANPVRAVEDGDEADENPIFSIGGGARTGTCWHDILEKLPFDATDETIREETLRSMRIHGLARGDEKNVENQVDTVSNMIRRTLDWTIVSPSGAQFKLCDVPMDRRFSEWEFDFSSAESAETTEAIATILNDEWKDDPAKDLFLKAVEKWNRQIPKGFLVGFLDLLFEHDGYYYVVDWKSNKLGGKVANFSTEGVKAEMAKEGYFFQYLLYSAVLHRFLKETLGPAYSWEKHFGGIRYYFLRGIAVEGEAPVFEDRPGENLLNRLCDALGLKG